MLKKILILLLCFLLIFPASTLAIGVEKITNYETGELILLNGKQIEVDEKLGLNALGFRGVWINTVWNNDFPKKAGLSESEFKKQYTELLNNLSSYYINAVIFQVRPSGDAFYFSDINPVSQFMTGKEGENATWDPLPWMIEETHKKGMEFHAWFNPYRVTHKDFEGGKEQILSGLSDKNWAKNNPGSVFHVGKKLYLKPWDPNVREHIKDTVMEVAKKYDIDAIHFDDYFYPSKSLISGDGFYPEESSYYAQNANGVNIAYWRREQTDLLIQSVKNAINSYNRVSGKKIKFGVSPRGIWGSLKMHREGSIEGGGVDVPSGSFSSFDDQFADTRKWIKNGWIDYVVPQVYWSFSEKAAPYGTVVDWWADVVKDTDVKLYIGHANYKLNEVSANKNMAWKNPREILNQLKFNQKYQTITGSVFFNASALYDTANMSNENKKFLDVLKKDLGESFSNLSSTSTGIKPSEELNIDETVKVDYAVFKTKYGNMVQWVDVYSGVYSHYVIYRVTNLGGVENKQPLSQVKKLSKSYIYIDRDFSGTCEYRIEAVK